MNAVVLVGGFGTRLRPLTLHTPKQMLPIVDRPMIEWVIEHLAQHGVDRAVLSLGYRPDAFANAFPDGTCAGVALEYAVEDEPLDTAGAIRFAARHAGFTERFLVANGDVLTDLDVSTIVDFHDRAGAEATITLHEVADPSRYGVVQTDDDGRVLAFVEKPPADEAPSKLINAGTYVLEPSVLDRIPDGRPVSIERDTFPQLVEDGRLYATDDRGVYWLDAGTPETYVQAQLDLVKGSRSAAPSSIAVDPSAVIAGTATVRGSVVGAGARIDEHAEVIDSIVMADATVGSKARVDHSVVGVAASIGERATLEALTIVGDGETIAADSNLEAARVPSVDS